MIKNDPIPHTSWRCVWDYTGSGSNISGHYWDAVFFSEQANTKGICIIRVKDAFYISRTGAATRLSQDIGPYASIYDAISAADTFLKLNGNTNDLFTGKL